MSGLLLHVCCAPCLAGPLGALRAEGFQPVGFFYNPNIHPLIEFRRRLKALKVFCESDPLPIFFCEEYGLETFLGRVWAGGPPSEGPGRSGVERCAACYRLRLERTAQEARARGIGRFTTTLLVSPHQRHDLVRRCGEEAAREAGVEFVYRDFRPLAGRSAEEARRRRLYRQSYCGCLFSEEERYRATRVHVYHGQGERR